MLNLPHQTWLCLRGTVRQITNTGQAAKSHNGLRGDFYESDAGIDGRWEYTDYEGSHWAKAYVVADGHLVAESDSFVVRIYG